MENSWPIYVVHAAALYVFPSKIEFGAPHTKPISDTMAPTYRIFEAGAIRSVATAVELKDGSILQVKPAKLLFPTLDAWQAAVGMDGRTMTTDLPQNLPKDNTLVLAALNAAQAVFKGTRFQPQYLRYPSVSVAERIVALKKGIRWTTEFKRANYLSAIKEGPLVGIGAFYQHMVIYSATFATLDAFYTYYKQMAAHWMKEAEAANVAAWVGRQPAAATLKEAQTALEALVPEADLPADAFQSDERKQLEDLEAQVRADPATANNTTIRYELQAKRTPQLFVMAGAGFFPIYYSAGCELIGIRGINGKMYRSFAAVGIKETPIFYCMHPELHIMKPLAGAL